MLYDVIVTRPFDKVFTYSSINEQLKIGQVVLVPFGKKIETGIIWKKNVEKPKHKIKEISKVIERCKEQEDDSGFLQHNFLNYLSKSEIKIFKGPLRNMVFDIIEKKKNKLSFIFGNLKATITNQGI